MLDYKTLLYSNLFEFRTILEGNRTTLRDETVYIYSYFEKA